MKTLVKGLGVAVMVALLLSACGGSSGSGGILAAPALTPPAAPVATIQLLKVTPASGATDVNADSAINATFSVTNAASVGSNPNLTLVCNGKSIVATAIPGALSADGKTLTYVFTPTKGAEQAADVCVVTFTASVVNSAGVVASVPVNTTFTVAAAALPPVCTPPSVYTNGVNACVYPMGVKVSGVNQLPAGCNTWKDQCWKDSVANGIVKWVATSALMTGYSTRPVVFAYFRNTSTAFGVTGLWNYMPLYADDGSLTGGDIFGGNTDEIDWIDGTPNGIIYHNKTRGFCYSFQWDAAQKSWDWNGTGVDTPVACPF